MNLKAYRAHQGLTLAETAKELGCDPQTVWRLEAGKIALSKAWKKRLSHWMSLRAVRSALGETVYLHITGEEE